MKMGISMDQNWQKDDSWYGRSYFVPNKWTNEDSYTS